MREASKLRFDSDNEKCCLGPNHNGRVHIAVRNLSFSGRLSVFAKPRLCVRHNHLLLTAGKWLALSLRILTAFL